MNILGIETSCDETSVALLTDGIIVASRTYTQEVHTLYGGVVPEVASRAHLDKIEPLCKQVLAEAGISLSDINLVAVTDSPGLAGALLVGVGFALGLHVGWGIPITGINHLEGHLYSAFLEYPELSYPFLSLAVSGGHTAIYKVNAYGSYQCLGKTVDDAAGEAFDKIGKMLGFAYPAGRAIEEAAQSADSDPAIVFPIAKMKSGSLNFSFSGLKTAVRYYLNGKDPVFIKEHRGALCKAFQHAVLSALVNNCKTAMQETGITTMTLVGGVACNGALRKALSAACPGKVYYPSPRLCTDNAAMIARAGYECFLNNKQRLPKMDPNADI